MIKGNEKGCKREIGVRRERQREGEREEGVRKREREARARVYVPEGTDRERKWKGPGRGPSVRKVKGTKERQEGRKDGRIVVRRSCVTG